MLNINGLKKYYNGKKVFMTGHTGFKGSYMCVLLKYLGAKIYGYSLKPEKGSLFELIKKGYNDDKSNKTRLIEKEVFADIRDYKKLYKFVKKVNPDYILHMAAQPLVLLGYEEPRYTYEVNVMGTVNLFEAIRNLSNKNSIKPISILNVTTDKVYENNDLSNYAFKEPDKLCGRDPYANSKSCSEIVTYAYEKSFFYDKNLYRISTARAGNVIGGGDLNQNRIIPDCFRAIRDKKEMYIRNPKSIRPYQYVLEPLILYLNILALQNKNKKYEGNYNIGPDKKNCLTTDILTNKFYAAYDKVLNEYAVNKNLLPKVVIDKTSNKSRHEAHFLRLDNSLIKKVFNYKEMFNMDKTMEHTAKVYFDMLEHSNIYKSVLEIISKLK